MDLRLACWRRRLMPPEIVAFEDATAAWFASALATAMQLELPKLVRGAVPLEELARELEVKPDILARLFDVLIGHGYFRWVDGRTSVEHTSLSRALEAGRAGSFCRLQAVTWYRDCFCPELVVQAMRGSEHPYRQMAGRHFFEVMEKEPEKGQAFAEAMAEITDFVAPWLAAAMDLEKGARVLDVGGGNGKLCGVLSSYYPNAEYAVLDMHPCGDEDGVEHQVGDFLQAVPSGYDHLILKNILHDWEDETALRILENCAAAVDPGARLFVVELLLPSDDPSLGFRDFQVDWNVYCTLGGRERRLADFERLLQRTGWRPEKATPTATPLWVLKAVRV